MPYDGSLSPPLQPEAWRTALSTIPDHQFTQYLLRGITHGFRVGVNEGATLKPAHRNLKSAYDHPEIISAYLQREVELGRMQVIPPAAGLHPPFLQLSPFGAIPKKHKPGKWRLIVDLSSPHNASVNNAISSDLCSVSYTSIDDAVQLVRAHGKGCLLAKLDLMEAYRAVPVHPSDQRLLGVSWQSTIYIDKALPFGLRSAPKIFSALTDAMMWMLNDRGVKAAIHYLDDFLLVGPAHSPSCGEALSTTLALCAELGFPVAPEKTEGPCATLTFLGIEIDSVMDQIRLPQEKLSRLVGTIQEWMIRVDAPIPKTSGKKRDLLSLIGRLSHAAMVVRPGRPFLRSLIDAASSVSELDHYVHLNSSARADLAWWHSFLRAWNGISIMPPTGEPLLMTSDASGSWGCGGVHENLWFQVEWPADWLGVSIAPKELAPIVIAAVLWGPYWAGKSVRCLCDNMAVVASINRRSARDPTLAGLLRTLAYVSATLDISFSAQHLPGLQNVSADAISRDNLPLFFSLNPQASPMPTIIPPELRELVFNRSLRWTSPSWRRLLSSSWIAALRLPPARPTNQRNGDT